MTSHGQKIGDRKLDETEGVKTGLAARWAMLEIARLVDHAAERVRRVVEAG